MSVVVTGMGVVSPLGCGVEPFWRALCAGQSGIRDLSRFDGDGFTFRRAGEVPAESVSAMDPPEHGDIDLGTRFVMAAAGEALAQAGLERGGAWQEGAGVVLATNFGGIAAGEAALSRDAADTAAFRELSFQAAADHVADLWSLRGPRSVIALSCASGAAALTHGAGLVRSGRAQTVLAGGYDALSRFAWSGLSALRTMTRDAIRPFDRTRSGTIFGEGAGVLVLEDALGARERGAPALAELAGCGLNNNAFHMTAPARGGAGSAAVMRAALADAGMDPAAIDHVNAHGTGTKQNDLTESQAVLDVFGPRGGDLPVTAVKSMTSHMMGAAGCAEAIVSILSIRDGLVPPTINSREPDPACAVNCVFGAPLHANVDTVLSNSAGIGGCNGAVIFRRAQT